MILFQKNALSLNTESNCVMLVELLRGVCKAVKLSQSMFILGKVSRRIPKHLSTKSAHEDVLAVLLLVKPESCYNF